MRQHPPHHILCKYVTTPHHRHRRDQGEGSHVSQTFARKKAAIQRQLDAQQEALTAVLAAVTSSR